MARKKLKKRGSKKKQKKTKKIQKEEKVGLPEVDKEFYEIQLSDLNSKFQRLKEQCTSLEEENLELKEKLVELDEDRADVIAFMKNMLHSKIGELTELKERIRALQQARETEQAEFSENFSNKESELKHLQVQLTTEMNLLNGKLNSLDEFRIQKEELMKKFQMQEKAQKDQESRHKEELHNIEKDFILKKIRMKNEVEEKLSKLSEDFQTLVQSKIDSSTKLTIEENLILSTEIKKLMETCKELINENDHVHKAEQNLKLSNKTLKEELKITTQKYIVTKKKFSELTEENSVLKERSNFIDKYSEEIQSLRGSATQFKSELEVAKDKNKKLDEMVNEFRKKEVELISSFKKLMSKFKNIERAFEIITTATTNVLKCKNGTYEEIVDSRSTFAATLLEILTSVKEDFGSDFKLPSSNFEHSYVEGNLGILLKN